MFWDMPNNIDALYYPDTLFTPNFSYTLIVQIALPLLQIAVTLHHKSGGGVLEIVQAAVITTQHYKTLHIILPTGYL